MTPSELAERNATHSTELKALIGLWINLLGTEGLPEKNQFALWLPYPSLILHVKVGRKYAPIGQISRFKKVLPQHSWSLCFHVLNFALPICASRAAANSSSSRPYIRKKIE